MDDQTIDRFWAKVDQAGTCWLWTGHRRTDGYGLFSIDGKTHRAHRVSFLLVNGPIPDGLYVLHNCPGGDNPSCVNPDHLFLGDAATNLADARLKGNVDESFPDLRMQREKHRKLTDDQAKEILIRRDKGESLRSIARSLGVAYGTVQHHLGLRENYPSYLSQREKRLAPLRRLLDGKSA